LDRENGKQRWKRRHEENNKEGSGNGEKETERMATLSRALALRKR